MGWIGFNCSIPHKVAVIEHLDGLGDWAMVIGAVNCAVRRGEKFIGENTDGKGFLQSLLEVVDPEGKQVVMFGAGGAARAIGVELALAGVTRITVVNRGESRGRTLVDLLNRKTKAEAELVVQGGAYKIPTEADIVVNATSIGLYPDIDGRLNLDVESLRPSLIVADVIPNPPYHVYARYEVYQSRNVQFWKIPDKILAHLSAWARLALIRSAWARLALIRSIGSFT